MGGRRSGSFRDLRGSSRRTRRAVTGLNRSIQEGAVPSAVVGAALGVLAASGPVGATLAAGVQIAQTVHDVYAATRQSEESGTPLPTALARAAAKTALSGAAGQVASQVAQAAVPGALAAVGAKVTSQQKKLIVGAVAGAVSGV